MSILDEASDKPEFMGLHALTDRVMQGVILYGEPGTGKTLLAKAVAHSTSASFLRVVGSELIQKYLGDGPKLVRELFRVADEMAPSIVFIGVLSLLPAPPPLAPPPPPPPLPPSSDEGPDFEHVLSLLGSS